VSLRSGIIEAGADAWARFEEGGDYELTGVQFARLREVSTVMLDAILDYLEANADEWRDVATRRYGLTFDGEGHGFQSWLIEDWVAALRIQENQP
jgi:hypothetical protein